ncbi:MarR family winged helix-turn-helix transcriptional regulator [Jannaschia sp. LMIT008]|uniref:MarR family winged helix-turn-helix transcriptional regulator n=1 Tax=Jannaschia maritima TaxID=3032585 RepID=UPI002812488E|nr:MarR family winged helix-turn-helix transcriptional regulator [Jannaschia sp. LMIT008]
MSDDDVSTAFAVLNEIGIIAQLGRATFEARLPPGVILPQWSVLNHLVRVGDGRTPLDMARAFQVPKTTMSHTVAALERRGWVEFRPNPDDGRSKRVWLTAAGRAFRDDGIASVAPDLARILGDLPSGTMEALLPHLRHLRETMDAARD